MDDLARHADGLRSLPPSCGPVRLVAVDGHAGSGKSTFAARLAAALGGAPVLHLDDLATHEELFGWTGRLMEQVILPLSRGEAARYAPYDWTERRFGPARTLEPAPVVLVEGVGAGRREVRPWLAALCWMEVDRATSWGRAHRVLGRVDTHRGAAFRRRSLTTVRRRTGTPVARGVRVAPGASRDSGSEPNRHAR
jgi:energy-coupling factor transporter ATP-binding protein EcfA2